MGRDFHDRSPEARETFKRANEVLGLDLAGICFEGPKEELDRTSVSQPAILTTSVAMLRALAAGNHEMIRSCEAAAGLSLGEYTAHVMAESIDFEAAVALVRKRGEFMEEACDANPGGMVSILGLSAEDVEAICREAQSAGIVIPANYNSPGQVVISGEQQALDRAAELATARGAKRVVPLAVSGAFHSPLMAPAAEKLKPELEAAEIRPPRFPVVANVTARAVREPEAVRTTLADQVSSPVRWQMGMEALIADGFDAFYEVGPGKVLTGLMKRIDRRANIHNISSTEGLDAVSASPKMPGGCRTVTPRKDFA